MSSAKWRPFCLGLNVLIKQTAEQHWNGNVIWATFSSLAALKVVKIKQLICRWFETPWRSDENETQTNAT